MRKPVYKKRTLPRRRAPPQLLPTRSSARLAATTELYIDNACCTWMMRVIPRFSSRCTAIYSIDYSICTDCRHQDKEYHKSENY